MLFKVTVAILAGLLLVCAGCQKKQDKSNDTAQAKAPITAAKGAGDSSDSSDSKAGESAEINSNTELDERAGITPDQNEKIRSAIMQAAQDRGLTYDKEYNAFRGEGLPKDGVSVQQLVDKFKEMIAGGRIELDDAMMQKIAQTVVADQIPPPKGVDIPKREEKVPESDKYRKDTKKNAQQEDPSKGKEQIDKSDFVPAKEIIGDWKSVKEIHARFTAKHSSDYFEYLNISPEKTIKFKRYREAKLISDRDFSYSFNEKSGELQLKDENGKVINTLKAYNKGDDKITLYLEYQSGTITVYKQVSKVGAPPTEDQGKGVAQPGVNK